MKRLFFILLTLAVILAAVLAVNTVQFASRQVEVDPAERLDLDQAALADRLAGALRFRTVSHQDPALFEAGEFLGFHGYLEETFPRVQAGLTREAINRFSLLYVWPGSQPVLAPLMLTAHMDVVPARAEDGWTHPPFGGSVDGGFVWGRGSLDDKVSLMAIMEAVETLLAQGFAPQRTVILAFGHDEEIGGVNGARVISQVLHERGIRPAALLDESGVITNGIVPGVDRPVALVGVAEKGYLTLELLAEAEAGHSSMPPTETAIGRLARALARLQDDPFPARLDETTSLVYDYVGPEMKLPLKAVFANKWLTWPLIIRQLAGSGSTNAGIRTTIAPTIIQAGTKENVLPRAARAVVNFRLLPGDTVASVTARVKKVIDDPGIKTALLGRAQEPSGVTDPEAPAFKALVKTIREVFPETIAAPYLVLAGTDAKHYVNVCDDILRFLPVRFTPKDLPLIHGIDERVSVENYAEAVNFYARFIWNWDRME